MNYADIFPTGIRSLAQWKSTHQRLAIRVYCITVYLSMEERHGVTLLQRRQYGEFVHLKVCGADIRKANTRCTTNEYLGV